MMFLFMPRNFGKGYPHGKISSNPYIIKKSQVPRIKNLYGIIQQKHNKIFRYVVSIEEFGFMVPVIKITVQALKEQMYFLQDSNRA